MASVWLAHTQAWIERLVRGGHPPPRTVALRNLHIHERIAEQVEAGDGRRAAALMCQHFDATQFHEDRYALERPVDAEFVKDIFELAQPE